MRSTTSKRVKAIYESGRKAFHGGGGQICFECRADMPDSVFSENYIKLLRITIVVEFSKQTSGRRMTNEVVAEYMSRVAQLRPSVGRAVVSGS